MTLSKVLNLQTGEYLPSVVVGADFICIGGGGGVDPPAPVGGEIGVEKLSYDLPEIITLIDARSFIIPSVSDVVPSQLEETVAALLARAEEDNPIPVMSVVTTAGITSTNTIPTQAELNSLITRASDVVSLINTTTELGVASPDVSPQQIENIVITSGVTSLNTLPETSELGTGLITLVSEVTPNQVVLVTLEADLGMFANSVFSNSGWDNPTNALGDTTSTAATLSAASSGIGGTTSNTVSGDIILDFRDVNLGDLTLLSPITLNVETSHVVTGIPVGQPTATTVVYQYSTDGVSYTTFHTESVRTAKSINSVDLTSVIGQDQDLLSNMRVRAVGSVTSGTGVGVSVDLFLYRTWLTFSSSKEYPT
jgi:hypothetical protein